MPRRCGQLIVVVQKSEKVNEVGENGVEREAVRAGRSSICSQLSCAEGRGMVDDLEAKVEIHKAMRMWRKSCIAVADGRFDTDSSVPSVVYLTVLAQCLIGLNFHADLNGVKKSTIIQ